jgi:rsbT co-antagonist protein RsbR
MDGASRELLTAQLDQHRAEIIDRGTDWVREKAIDLGTQRPREETRRLVEQVVSSQSTALLLGDTRPLEAFIELVTSLRSSSEFHVSTVLRGLLSFRRGLEDVLRVEGTGRADLGVVLDLLAAVDEVAHGAVYRAADVYNEKLNGTILRRRADLERDLAQLTAAKERELDEKARTIDAQRALLNELSSPVIPIWDGILVIPLMGELDPERADVMRERVLDAVMRSRARTVLVDITGLTVTDAGLASEILHLVKSLRLIGADTLLVGLSPQSARELTALHVRFDRIRSFATLHDGLRAAFQGAGLRVVRG